MVNSSYWSQNILTCHSNINLSVPVCMHAYVALQSALTAWGQWEVMSISEAVRLVSCVFSVQCVSCTVSWHSMSCPSHSTLSLHSFCLWTVHVRTCGIAADLIRLACTMVTMTTMCVFRLCGWWDDCSTGLVEVVVWSSSRHMSHCVVICLRGCVSSNYGDLLCQILVPLYVYSVYLRSHVYLKDGISPVPFWVAVFFPLH